MSCFSSNQGIVAWLEKKTGPVAVDLTDVKAAEKLKAEHSVNIRILDPFTIKPIDKEAIIANAKECGGRIITVEDHYSEVCLNKLCALSSLVDKIIILMKVEIQSITY